MGAIFSLSLAQADWDAFNTWRQTNHFTLIGTSDSAATDYQSVDYTRPLILLMGSERHGLTAEMTEACDQIVAIPMAGRSDSLNLAVATAVLLYEIYNQNRRKE
jgi:TrmH family RNA methyltransferase